MIRFKQLNKNKGAISLVMVLIVMAAMLGVTTTMFLISSNELDIIRSSLNTNQSYYAAESGLEDVLLRIKNGWSIPESYDMYVGDASTTVISSVAVGGSQTFTSSGEISEQVRKVAVTYEITTDDVSFNYGAQAGDGGVVIENGCTIDGNIFTNGPIVGQGNHSVTGTVKVASANNYIDDLNVDVDAYVDVCNDSDIDGDLYTNTNNGCTADNIYSLDEEVATASLPITDELINEWKTEAEAGGTHTGSLTVENGEELYLGPLKIAGSLRLEGDGTIFITGTLWVTGSLTMVNSGRLQLDSSFGNLSGAVVVDGVSDFNNTSKAVGSGVEGSYLVIASTNNGNPAISITNSFEADILFALNGWVVVKNSTNIREITGYGIHIQNNAGLIYEVGLADAAFSSGPGGSWAVSNWREVE